MGGVACSQEMQEYFSTLEKDAGRCYRIASNARKMGLDPELRVEIPRAEDLASRVERLLRDYDVKGIAKKIRNLSKKHNREEVSLLIAKELARKSKDPKEVALDKAIRVGLAILTEGILVAPLEGLASVKIKRNRDNTTYADVYYSGPIRSAGGTGQALSVLIADVVRRELGIGAYRATREEVERFKEEIPLYKRLQHLQHTPTPEEIELIVSQCPIGINGEGTEDSEISGHRDLPRIETNHVRGGACLVIAEGLCLKAPKIRKHVSRLNIDGWDFIDRLLKKKTDDESQKIQPDFRYIQNIIAGRPILSHPSRAGGFRLRYGRSRATGLAALGINPATMRALDNFIAIGTQIKIERPSKAGAVTPCDSIEGPILLMQNGDLIQVSNEKDVPTSGISTIVDLGEILIPYGEFIENNHLLIPGAYSIEVYLQELRSNCEELPSDWQDPTPERAFEISEKHGVPLHPKFNLFWHDLTVEEVHELRDHFASEGEWGDGVLLVPRTDRIKDLVIRLGATHKERNDRLVFKKYSQPLIRCLGLKAEGEDIRKEADVEASDPLDLVSGFAGIEIRARAPSHIGARMARPEKAKERLMKPAPHSLFPVGRLGGPQRLLRPAIASREVTVEVGIRICEKCGSKWVLPRCPCGGTTRPTKMVRKQRIPIAEIHRAAVEGLGEGKTLDPKCVQGMISRSKTPEALEKGILRCKHGVFVFKDGTTRYDMTDLPLTHFKPGEIHLSVERARELGYEKDIDGRPLEHPDQLVELRPQDIVASKLCGKYLVNVAGFLDDLLEKFYGLERFYNAKKPDDMIGHLVVGLAPHTSGGVLARLIGYTEARACYAHPYFHAAKRRNCDGDEDCIMLLLDGLLNFSRSYLPEKRGGLMDAPLVLTTRIIPNEIDKEAHNIDLGSEYPLEFYEAANRCAHPREVESIIDTVGKRIGSVLQYEGLGFSHDATHIAAGPLKSVYKAGSMIEKMEAQLGLARKTRAVDVSDVVTRIVTHHFLPDLIGNLKAFSTQQVRCTKCNTKFRRIPLRKRCSRCGGNLTLTVHKNSVKKYLEVSKRISEEYGISTYVRQRIGLIDEAIESLFSNDKVQCLKLDDFCQ
ncbi:MAG: DNA polymerase II large subunit [Thermoplasmata archaeon]